MSDYDNTNSGALFPAQNMKIIRQGKIDVEGKEDAYALCQVETKTGKTIFEVYQKVGAVFVNDRKRDEKDADMSGTITLEGNDYMVWGRKRESKNGTPFTSVSVALKQNKSGDYGGSSYADDYRDKRASGVPRNVNDDPSPAPASIPNANDFDDDIPF